MDYSELSAEDQQTLDDYLQFARPLLGEVARLMHKFSAVNSDWTNGAQGVVASLTAGVIVPNKTGLAGAASLTKEDIQASAALIAQALSGYESATNRNRWVKAAGAVNTI